MFKYLAVKSGLWQQTKTHDVYCRIEQMCLTIRNYMHSIMSYSVIINILRLCHASFLEKG